MRQRQHSSISYMHVSCVSTDTHTHTHTHIRCSQFWFSWRNQIREFNKDYRVVAIDMRGYGDSSRPPNKLDYTVDKLSKDIAELIPALGYSKCTLVAHDWGGEVGWYVNCTRTS